ncbi:restriction endonuclease subunit S [Parasaccharibacter sp. TMW 2.1891]|uniref:restriction endonuclease subunit S n=1 Tax=Parasaccharibacter sp. TMW 2.1891 TaxID=2267836 RepID=UPI0020116A58|nr:restriction endonuclease subunit S [Parasaccharibacter sp. TMW 2.1891]MCL1513293.1 restriction endonuclease subunit S [Parasaccharibacter sp. TMW 2.1891]
MKILSDAADFMSGGTPNKANPAFWGGDISWYSASNMTDRFIGNGSPKITYEGLIAGSKMAPKGSSLILVRGSGLFNYIPICYVEKAVAFNQDVKAICPKDDTDPVFLHFWMESLRNTLNQNLGVTGIGAGKLDTDFLKNLPFPNLSRKKQEYIAQYAQSFDRKIELNRRTNETLEAMARALFRDWFVDFGPTRAKMAGEAPYLAPEVWELFPDRLDDEGKPEGWHRVLLNDLISVTKGRSYKSSELQESETALVTLKSFMRGGGYRHDGLKAFTGKYHDDQIVSPGDLIVALTDVTQAADVIGKPAIVVHDQKYKTLVASLDVGIIRKKTELTGMSFIYQILLSEEFQNHAYSYTSGTTVLHLNKEAIPSFEVCIPSQKLGAFLENSLDTMKEKVISNFKEINSLAQLRDLLLPKLMSGEISIRDAEKMVEDAA